MRKQIAAANWKMNLTLPEAEQLTKDILSGMPLLQDGQHVIMAVPFPYLHAVQHIIAGKPVSLAAQNVASEEKGAYTGETSAAMLASVNVPFVLIGHSERRQFFHEDNLLLARKIDIALGHGLQPVFCCGEPQQIREENTQNQYVEQQIAESLFHLSKEQMQRVIIAYEPIWAIGTGLTASTEQAQEMHKQIRIFVAGKYGEELADNLTILYGGSVKGANAADIFAQPDVDGGLVGGASLVASEFTQIINGLKK